MSWFFDKSFELLPHEGLSKYVKQRYCLNDNIWLFAWNAVSTLNLLLLPDRRFMKIATRLGAPLLSLIKIMPPDVSFPGKEAILALQLLSAKIVAIGRYPNALWTQPVTAE